jgi:hypothetical protein
MNGKEFLEKYSHMGPFYHLRGKVYPDDMRFYTRDSWKDHLISVHGEEMTVKTRVLIQEETRIWIVDETAGVFECARWTLVLDSVSRPIRMTKELREKADALVRRAKEMKNAEYTDPYYTAYPYPPEDDPEEVEEIVKAPEPEEVEEIVKAPEPEEVEEIVEETAKEPESEYDFWYDYMPESEKNVANSLEAVSLGSSLQYVPKHLRNYDVCLAAVHRNGWNLQHVPDSLRNLDICFAAVRQNGSALEFVPRVLKTDDLNLDAVRTDWFAIKYVPKDMMSEEVCLLAINQDGRALAYIEETRQTEEMKSIAEVKLREMREHWGW